MAPKSVTATAPAADLAQTTASGLLSGLTPEYVDAPKGQRTSKFAPADIASARELLARTYESGQAAKFTLKDEDAVKLLTNLFRHVAQNSGGGVSLKAEGNVLFVKGKDRKNIVEGKPRKPRATKGLEGTPEYLRRMDEYNAAMTEWNTANEK